MPRRLNAKFIQISTSSSFTQDTRGCDASITSKHSNQNSLVTHHSSVGNQHISQWCQLDPSMCEYNLGNPLKLYMIMDLQDFRQSPDLFADTVRLVIPKQCCGPTVCLCPFVAQSLSILFSVLAHFLFSPWQLPWILMQHSLDLIKSHLAESESRHKYLGASERETSRLNGTKCRSGF